MAENTVVKDQLTSAMVEVGAALASKLDEMGVATTAALWSFEPELNEWRLVFASSEVATRGPREIYEKIRLAIGQLDGKATAVPLSSVVLMDSNADLIRLLRVALKTGGETGPIRFSRNVINGHFIDDALIYRIT